ncbi:MAG: SEL1-like repeat protein [Proteobacteria bacterium]|nr:SEL1-like repeat protein [Pseudomonadota bacterium]
MKKIYLLSFLVLFLTIRPSFADINAANDALARGDHAAAAAEFQKLAKQGDKKAQAHLGYMYYVGEGVEQDYVQAVKWYKKAAILGDKDSQYNLAVAYAFGEGAKQDYKEAFHWYRRAAEQNHIVAQYSIGISYAYGEGIAQNPELAAEWFTKSADQGYERAQILLGSLYHTGDGVEKDYQKAAFWYRKAADRGNSAAQYNLGTLYRAGHGVKQDYNQAVRWFRLSADQGYAAAQNELASMERAIAGANRPTPVAVPEIETAPVQTKTDLAEIVGETTDSIPTLSKSEPALTETAPTESEIATEEERTSVVEADGEIAVVEAAAEEKPKRGFFSRLFGKKDTSDPAPDQSGVVYATPEEIAAAESTYVPVPDTETEAAEDIVSPDLASPEPAPTESEIVTEEKRAPVVEADEEMAVVEAAAEEKPKRGFFSRLFGKKDAPEVVEESLDEPAKVITYAADSAPVGQQLETSHESEITESQNESDAAAVQLPVDISSGDITLAEPDSADGDETETTIEEISEVEAPKRGFFTSLFGTDTPEKNKTGENADTAKTIEIAESDEIIVIAKLEEPDLDEIRQREYEEAFIDSIEVAPDLEDISSASDLQPLAVKGDSNAQFQLGALFYQGKGVQRDYTQAFLWYRRAAQQGNSDAQYSLGNMYLMGEGIKQDDYQARQWYEKAAEQGHGSAQHNLESLQRIAIAEPEPESDYDQKDNLLPEPDEDDTQEESLHEETEDKRGFFSKLFGKGDDDEEDESIVTDGEVEEAELSNDQISVDNTASTRDSAKSIYEKGLAHEFGEGVVQSYSIAFEYFKKSAEQNYAPAQYKMGLAYAYGQGTEKDPVAAAEWYQKSAKQGYALAQRTLGTLYMGGDGVERNKPLALAWYDILADGGNVMDIHRRDSLKENLTPDEIDKASELKRELSN